MRFLLNQEEAHGCGMDKIKQKPGSIPLALTIVVGDKERQKKTLEILECQKAYFSMVSHGYGTASSTTLAYLGLGETKKNVYMSVRTTEVAREVLNRLDSALELGRHGHGIAFMIEIEKGCYHKPITIAKEEQGEETMEQTTAHELILAVLNQGYTEDVMEAAREAGANGGTAIHGRGCGLAGAEKFFGITIQPEKEIIFIAAPVEQVDQIMKAIADKCGPETDAGAISFAIPLKEIRGISPEIPAEHR